MSFNPCRVEAEIGGGQDDAMQTDPPPHFIGSVILHIHVTLCVYVCNYVCMYRRHVKLIQIYHVQHKYKKSY